MINEIEIVKFFFFLIMKTEISLIHNSNIFTSKHINQTIKNIKGYSIKVNSKHKWLKAYTRGNLNMSKILKILYIMKYTDK